MTNAKTQYIVSALLVILVLVAGYFGIKLPVPVIPDPLPGVTIEGGPEPGGVGLESAIGQSIKFDRNIRAAQDVNVVGDLDVDSTLNVDGTATIDGTITASGSINLADDITMDGALDVGTTATLPLIVQTLATTVTVTNGSTIATNGDIVPLTAAGNVGTDDISLCETAGRVTLFWNASDTTITITETGNLKLSGDAALGQFDTLMLLGDGTNCIELAQTNN